MSSSRGCTNCGNKSLSADEYTFNLVCNSCGVVQEYENYDAQLGGIDGPQGTFVRVGTAGSGTHYSYNQKKILEAHRLINEVTFKLDLTDSKSAHIKTMIATLTENEFGQGDWFTVLIGACAYIVMRKENKALPIAEIASVIGFDIFELGRMIGRVVDFLNLKKGPEEEEEFPEFDIVSSFERALRKSPSFSRHKDKVETMLKQGIFLIQCSVKWFLTTGRRPLPMVAAVLVFVAELNEIRVDIRDVAEEIHATVSTARTRYRELLEVLVKVAQKGLPWGKDVTVKNLVKNAPFVMEYMERKSMATAKKSKKLVEGVGGLDLGDVMSECLRKEYEYGEDEKSVEDDAQYFKVEENNSKFKRASDVDLENMNISHECLSLMYTEFLNEMRSRGGSGEVHVRKRKGEFQLGGCRDWWNGKSELSKKLLLKQILEKDVGLDVLPPSFVAGCNAYKRRREKINAAKLRINRIKHPSGTDSGDILTSECVHPGKKRKGRRVYGGIDWEDLIIETLLLHRVKEEEIEKGHYNALLDLYVFKSGIL